MKQDPSDRRTFLKSAVAGAAAGLLGGAWVAVLLAAAGSASAQTVIERGSYLVNAVMVCDGCHTPRGPGGKFVMESGSRADRNLDTPAYTVKGSNSRRRETHRCLERR